MIRYDLKCSKGCAFDAWFKNSAAFDALQAAGQLSCVHCGSTEVEKAPMAPRVSTSKTSAPIAPPEDARPAAAAPMAGALSTPENPELARKIKDLQDYLDKNSDDVGAKFADEARKIHYGEADSRQIHGVASLEEAQELTEEGVGISPLPLLPRKGN